MIRRKFAFATFAALFANSMVFAGMDYIVPWYGNPTLVEMDDAATQAAALKATAEANAGAYAERLATVNAANSASYAGTLRMSHTAYFRPRLYIVQSGGSLAILTLDRDDGSAIKWTTAYSADELAAAAGVSATALTDIEVTDDGKTAFVEFDGSGTYYALQHTAPEWTYYPADAEDNPCQTETKVACISDGKWVLRMSNYWSISGDWLTGIYADCDAEILDLSKGIYTYNGTNYEIVGHPGKALTPADSSWHMPRIIVDTPRLRTDNQCWKHLSTLEEYVLVSSSFEIMHYTYQGFLDNVAKAELKLTKIGNIVEGAFRLNSPGFGETAWEDISLSAVTNVAPRAFTDWQASGVLELPAVVNIGIQAFQYCSNMTGVVLGRAADTVTNIATEAFLNATSLERAEIGAAASGAWLSNKAFANGGKLSKVVFHGGVACFANTSVKPFGDTAEKTMVFAIPRGDSAWTEFLGDSVTELTEEERTARRAADPDGFLPFGVVPASVFHTYYDQYVAYNDTEGVYAAADYSGGLAAVPETRFDATLGDTVEKVFSPAYTPDANGCVPAGTTLTLTPVASSSVSNGRFVKWYGDVPGGVSADSPLTLTLTGGVDCVYARFVHDWTVTPVESGATIADNTVCTANNGNFTINCYVVSASARTLALGKDATANGLFAGHEDIGSGICDLGGDVFMEGDDTPWTFAYIYSKYDTSWAKPGQLIPASSSACTGIVTPGTLVNWVDGQLFHGSSGTGKAIETLIIDEPGVEKGTLGNYQDAEQKSLAFFILRMPGLQSLNTDRTFTACTLAATKLDWWDLSSVTSVHARAFASWGGPGAERWRQAAGTLSLPAMRDVATTILTNETQECNFQNSTCVEGWSFGGADYATTVTNIGSRAFAWCPKLETLSLHASPDMAVGTNIFGKSVYNSAGHVPSVFRFTGKAISETAISNLLADVSTVSTAAKPVTIYASRLQNGWGLVGTKAGWISDATAGEISAYPGEKVLGVYRMGAAAPSGKAVILHAGNDWDPPIGLSVIIR